MKRKTQIGLGLLVASVLLVVGAFAAPLFNFAEHGVWLSALGMAVPMLTKEEEEAKAALLTEIKSQVDKQLSTRMSKDDVDKLVGEALKEFKSLDVVELQKMLKADSGVMAMLAKQGAEITALKEKGANNNEPVTSKQVITEWHKKNSQVIQALKKGQKLDIPEIEFKVAASPMTPSNSLNSSSYLPVPAFEAGIHDLRRVQPTMWDYLPKGRTSQAAYVWVNRKNPQGAAGFIGPGVAKAGISFELETEISNAKKIAESLKIATELLDDIDGMNSFVQSELAYQLKKKLNTTLMTGTLSSTVPAGIQTFSQTYSLSGVHCVNPNDMDAIRAVVAMIRTNYIDAPVTIFVNPVDAANMEMAKASTSGVYLLPPFYADNGMRIAGATIVEDNNVSVGYLQAACLDLFKNLIYKDFTVSFGWENDDFTKNLVTAIGEMRLHSFHSAVDANAFVYDRFSTIKAAISNS